MFAVVLDTCVLWPSLQRDFLLSLAAEGVYRPLWSDRILEELEYEEACKLEARGATADEARARAAALIRQMNGAFDDSCVTGWERLDGTYGLPDPDDEHVVAAAEFAGAGAIVTMNTKHFPLDHLPSSIGIQTPTQFALAHRYRTHRRRQRRRGRAARRPCSGSRSDRTCNRPEPRLGLAHRAIPRCHALLESSSRTHHRLRVHWHERRCVRGPGGLRSRRCITRVLSGLGRNRSPQPLRRRIPDRSPAHHDRTRPTDSCAGRYHRSP